MKNLFDRATVDEIKERIVHLGPESPRQWGRMTSAQAAAHCCRGLEMAMGEIRPPRAAIGRVIGWAIKPLVFRDDEPFRRNSPTARELIVEDNCNFAVEQQRLAALVDRFASVGPSGCTTHPHSFFGSLTPMQWSVLMYKHLDHHLRQFGV
ncbi:MAG TPA: DUF1569 domain-containing protein [Alloacidobacterium sp.]|nr:DUF1569 domain-containing protein [Alloacidobacterium sp.]